MIASCYAPCGCSWGRVYGHAYKTLCHRHLDGGGPAPKDDCDSYDVAAAKSRRDEERYAAMQREQACCLDAVEFWNPLGRQIRVLIA